MPPSLITSTYGTFIILWCCYFTDSTFMKLFSPELLLRQLQYLYEARVPAVVIR